MSKYQTRTWAYINPESHRSSWDRKRNPPNAGRRGEDNYAKFIKGEAKGIRCLERAQLQ
ncbi:hypothetical protein J6590_041921 [Homalodisca vitripennis]|nr:hypothetical protein J6590_041921 [Homalodisca vitripennis]